MRAGSQSSNPSSSAATVVTEPANPTSVAAWSSGTAERTTSSASSMSASASSIWDGAGGSSRRCRSVSRTQPMSTEIAASTDSDPTMYSVDPPPMSTTRYGVGNAPVAISRVAPAKDSSASALPATTSAATPRISVTPRSNSARLAASRVAALDCGTNSLRLLVADVDPAAGTLHDVLRRMEIVRLGQEVDRTGRLDPDALTRTFAVLREYAEQIRELGAERVRLCATSATRDAANRAEFERGVTDILGVAGGRGGTQPDPLGAQLTDLLGVLPQNGERPGERVRVQPTGPVDFLAEAHDLHPAQHVVQSSGRRVDVGHQQAQRVGAAVQRRNPRRRFAHAGPGTQGGAVSHAQSCWPGPANRSSASRPKGLLPGAASSCATSTCRHFTRSGIPPALGLSGSASTASRRRR